MRALKFYAPALLATVVMLGATQAWSHGGYRHHGHRHHGSSLHLGFAFGGPLWYPAPAFVYPPTVVVPAAPRVYVERDDAAVSRESAPGYWYYCRDSNVYYPYVKECAGAWERIPAHPR